MPAPVACAFVELRQYTLVPGARRAFIELFEREFIETQEAVGMRLLGIFCDLGDPDRFVWLRGFADMRSRRQALIDFYTGPCWRTHGAEANSMMIDSDHVHLLQPVPGYPTLEQAIAQGPTATDPQLTVVVEPVGATTEPFADVPLAAELLAVLQSASVENDFPQLPVIEDEAVTVRVLRGNAGSFNGARQVIRLAPSERSALR
jgi:hypothetical protein